MRACEYKSGSIRELGEGEGPAFVPILINNPSALCGPSLGHKHHSGCVVVQLCSGESFM